MLHRRHDGEIMDPEHNPQEGGIAGGADRLGLKLCRVGQIRERVAVEEERRPVGELDDHPQHRGGGEQPGEEPVAGHEA